jgi:hypothetical protein
MAEEIDWETISSDIESIITDVEDLSNTLCQAKQFKACIMLNEKVITSLKQLKQEADAHVEIGELAEEEVVEEEEEEGEEE